MKRNSLTLITSLLLSLGVQAGPSQSIFGFGTSDLVESPRYTEISERDYTAQDFPTDVVLAQILKATNSATYAEAIDAVDENTINYVRFNFKNTPKAEYAWVSYYSGDTEAGLIFVSNSAHAVAEVSDSELVALAEGYTGKIKFRVLEQSCGELDPMALGDACLTYILELQENGEDGYFVYGIVEDSDARTIFPARTEIGKVVLLDLAKVPFIRDAAQLKVLRSYEKASGMKPEHKKKFIRYVGKI